MKIEVGESLLHSWLRHIQGCQIAQLNWKRSGKDRPTENLGKHLAFFNTLKDELGFSVKQGLSQILRQTEADVIGISLQQDSQVIHIADIAFHVNRLAYGKEEYTIEKIARKMFSSALALYCDFGLTTGIISFASPNVKGNVDAYQQKIMSLQEVFRENGFGFQFELYFNERFRNEILIPVIRNSRSYNDTSEIFVRSTKLLEVFKLLSPALHTSDPVELEPGSSDEEDLQQTYREILESGRKIGQTAKLFFAKLGLDNNLGVVDDANLIINSFPVLKSVSTSDSIEGLRRINNYSRYYAEPFKNATGQQYLLTSQWREADRSVLEQILQTNGLI